MSDTSNPLPVNSSEGALSYPEETATSRVTATRSARRTYAAPQLVVLGSVRDLTLGKSGKSRDGGISPVKP